MEDFRAISMATIIAALAFAVATSIFSFLTAVSTAFPKCAGQEVLLGYRAEAADFWAWPLFSLFFVAPTVVARYSHKTSDLLSTYDIAIFQSSSFKVTLGMFILFSSLFGFVALNGVMMVEAAIRYRDILGYCH